MHQNVSIFLCVTETLVTAVYPPGRMDTLLTTALSEWYYATYCFMAENARRVNVRQTLRQQVSDGADI